MIDLTKDQIDRFANDPVWKYLRSQWLNDLADLQDAINKAPLVDLWEGTQLAVEGVARLQGRIAELDNVLSAVDQLINNIILEEL